MPFALPTSMDELETLAVELSDLLDSIAADAVDGCPLLEQLLLGALDDVEVVLVKACSPVALVPA
jgi:hypothetical protein